MKTYFAFLAIFLTAAPLCAHGQINQLKDTLIKETFVADVSGDFFIHYKDITNKIDELPYAKDKDGEKAEVLHFSDNDVPIIYCIAHEIFTPEEINRMRKSSGAIKFISLAGGKSDGKVVSVSFIFVEKDPEIPLSKMIKFSEEVKENTTHTTEFSQDIAEEGYVQSSLSWFMLLRKGKK